MQIQSSHFTLIFWIQIAFSVIASPFIRLVKRVKPRYIDCLKILKDLFL